jgi:hypothetical protein
MAYHDLSECTLSPSECLAEAKVLAAMISKEKDAEDLTKGERSIVEMYTEPCSTNYCTIKQLFWLRDIKDKYL